MAKKKKDIEDNKKYIELLRKDPGKLVVKYQDLISTVVYLTLIGKGFYHKDEKDELIQEVNVRLLERMGDIKKKYNKKSLLRTFFWVIIKNTCYGILREKKRRPTHSPLNGDETNRIPPTANNILINLVFEDEFRKYEAILKTYYRNIAKIELILQLVYRIPVLIRYFINYCKKFAESFYEAVPKILPIDKDFPDIKIYNIITPYLNKCNGKDNPGSSTQRWMNNIINQHITLMNIGHEPDVYDKDIFQIVVEKYYQFKK